MPRVYEPVCRRTLLCGSRVHKRRAVVRCSRPAAAPRHTGRTGSRPFVGWWISAGRSYSGGAPGCTVSSPTKQPGPRSARGVAIQLGASSRACGMVFAAQADKDDQSCRLYGLWPVNCGSRLSQLSSECAVRIGICPEDGTPQPGSFRSRRSGVFPQWSL